MRKLTPKCMYLPVHEEHDQAAVDLEGAFKPLPLNGGQQGLADYLKNRIRCLPSPPCYHEHKNMHMFICMSLHPLPCCHTLSQARCYASPLARLC